MNPEHSTPSEDDIRQNNEHQKEEALGEDNRWFASQHFGRPVTDPGELMMYYIQNGGAEGHRQRMEQRRQELDQLGDQEVGD